MDQNFSPMLCLLVHRPLQKDLDESPAEQGNNLLKVDSLILRFFC